MNSLTNLPRQARGEGSCVLCHCNIVEGEQFLGDVCAVFSLIDPPVDGLGTICRSCGEIAPFLVDLAIQELNRKRPELRLTRPYRDSLFGDPIPNLSVCSDYFDKCNSARISENAAEEIAELLVRFFQDYPVEWRCSEWKNDFIAELVLGQIPQGEIREQKKIAASWFSRYWAYLLKVDRQISVDNSELRQRALDAVLELQALEDDDFHPAQESYKLYAEFVRWLTASVPELSYEPGSLKFIFSAVKRFRREQPQSPLKDKVLTEIAAAFGRYYKPARERITDNYMVDPSKVILELVARRHGVSSRLVAELRSQVNKRNARS